MSVNYSLLIYLFQVLFTLSSVQFTLGVHVESEGVTMDIKSKESWYYSFRLFITTVYYAPADTIA